MSLLLLVSSACLVAGGLLLVQAAVAPRRVPLPLRLPRVLDGVSAPDGLPAPVGDRVEQVRRSYARQMRQAGRRDGVGTLVRDKFLLAATAPLVLLMPYAAATGRLPSAIVLLVLAVGAWWAPDLVLRQAARQRRETIALDLPDAVAVLTLALRAGQSLRQALELAARDCPGPLGDELTRALSISRRERGVSERQALVRVGRDSGEPSFARFAELLAAKESPYIDFLRSQARAMRAEQHRVLERAADRAYLAMHAPLVPLLIVLVLLVAYGFLNVLSESI
ncbi:MAG TPA: type II secretion system F family protein [Conexibacter sp.]